MDEGEEKFSRNNFRNYQFCFKNCKHHIPNISVVYTYLYSHIPNISKCSSDLFSFSWIRECEAYILLYHNRGHIYGMSLYRLATENRLTVTPDLAPILLRRFFKTPAMQCGICPFKFRLPSNFDDNQKESIIVGARRGKLNVSLVSN